MYFTKKMNSVFFAIPNAFNDTIYDIENTSNVVLPNSFFASICNDEDYEFPYHFEIEPVNDSENKKKVFVTVSEFSADNETVVIPFWVFENLNIQPYDPVKISYKHANPGKYLKIQPHQTKFIKQNDPRKILEEKLSNFACLTSNTTISFVHNDEIYKFNIIEIKDEDGSCDCISLINIDLNIEFESPLDEKKSEIAKKKFEIPKTQKQEIISEEKKFIPFSGKSSKLGK